MAEQELVNLLQYDERWALHPFVGDIGPTFLDAEIYQSSLYRC